MAQSPTWRDRLDSLFNPFSENHDVEEYAAINILTQKGPKKDQPEKIAIDKDNEKVSEDDDDVENDNKDDGDDEKDDYDDFDIRDGTKSIWGFRYGIANPERGTRHSPFSIIAPHCAMNRPHINRLNS